MTPHSKAVFRAHMPDTPLANPVEATPVSTNQQVFGNEVRTWKAQFPGDTRHIASVVTADIIQLPEDGQNYIGHREKL